VDTHAAVGFCFWEGRMQVKLTKRMLDSFVPETDRQLLFDSELSGFGIRVMRSGVRTFFVQYRTAGGRRGRKRRVTIGRYGPLTVEQARVAAKQMLGEVAHGGDPAATRKARKTAPTVAELGVDFLANAEAKRKPSTALEYRRIWKRHLEPELGTTLVVGVTTAELSALHRRMRATPYLANRTLSLAAAFFSFAERQGCSNSRVESGSRDRALPRTVQGAIPDACRSSETR
jgi:hypothetical protein